WFICAAEFCYGAQGLSSPTRTFVEKRFIKTADRSAWSGIFMGGSVRKFTLDDTLKGRRDVTRTTSVTTDPRLFFCGTCTHYHPRLRLNAASTCSFLVKAKP